MDDPAEDAEADVLVVPVLPALLLLALLLAVVVAEVPVFDAVEVEAAVPAAGPARDCTRNNRDQ